MHPNVQYGSIDPELDDDGSNPNEESSKGRIVVYMSVPLVLMITLFAFFFLVNLNDPSSLSSTTSPSPDRMPIILSDPPTSISEEAKSNLATADNNPSTNNSTEANNDSTTSSIKVIASLDMAREGPLMDLIHLLDESSAQQIVQEIQTVEQDVPDCEIQVVLVNDIPNTSGYHDITPREFATALFDTWNVGGGSDVDGLNNAGVLILFMLDIRRIEVVVGASLDGYMNHDWTTKMLQEVAVPNFKDEKYGIGLEEVVERIADRLRYIQDGFWPNFLAFFLDFLLFSCVGGSVCLMCHEICQCCGNVAHRRQVIPIKTEYYDNYTGDGGFGGGGGDGGGGDGGGGGASW